MDIAIILLVGIITGFLMGRQNTRDKVNVEQGRPLDMIIKLPEKELEPSEFELGFDNILAYDGTEQGDKE